MLALILFTGIILFFIIFIELISRKYLISTDISRKGVHIGAAFVVSAMPIFLEKNEIPCFQEEVQLQVSNLPCLFFVHILAYYLEMLALNSIQV